MSSQGKIIIGVIVAVLVLGAVAWFSNSLLTSNQSDQPNQGEAAA
ncbi:hypothetical protein [Bacillus xiapuensis]|nr:hypothetical protein [Bacillus xiapuensis]